MEAKERDRFMWLPVRHGSALALVYTATLSAWIWSICDAAANGLASQRRVDWIQRNNKVRWFVDHADWFALGVTVIAAAIFLQEFRRHDPDAWKKRSPKPTHS